MFYFVFICEQVMFNSLGIVSSQILWNFFKTIWIFFWIWSDISDISCLSCLSMTSDKFLFPIMKTLNATTFCIDASGRRVLQSCSFCNQWPSVNPCSDVPSSFLGYNKRPQRLFPAMNLKLCFTAARCSSWGSSTNLFTYPSQALCAPGTSNECAELLTSTILVVQWWPLERDSNEDGMHQKF